MNATSNTVTNADSGPAARPVREPEGSATATTTGASAASDAAVVPAPFPARLARVAGALGLAHVVLLLAGIAVQDTVLFSDGRDGIAAYADGILSRTVLGLYVELVGFLLLLPVLVAVAAMVGRRTDGGRWAARTALLAGVGYVVLTFSPGIASGAVAMHAVQNGVDVDTAWTMNNLRVVTYVVSLMLLGAHAIGTGMAAVADRFGTRTVGWTGIVTGVVLLTAPLLLAPNLHDLTTLVWLLWWAGLCVRLLRQK